MNCRISENKINKVEIAHGGGGRMSNNLIKNTFIKRFSNKNLDKMSDGAVLNMYSGKVAYTTDSYVVNPIFFKGGNIGDLAINGTINDLTACGAIPQFISAAFIIEEGFDLGLLEKIADSMSLAAKKANVTIVTGDTKVVEKGKCDGIFINTSGIGLVNENISITPERIKENDAIIITGKIASHGMCIMAERNNLGFETDIQSDTASLNQMINRLLEDIDVHMMRDPTRGGVASALNEIAETANLSIVIDENSIPIDKNVISFCELLGFDPLSVANEGCMILFVNENDASKSLEILQQFEEGKNSRIIGKVESKNNQTRVIAKTIYGSSRIIEMITGEQLPRIC